MFNVLFVIWELSMFFFLFFSKKWKLIICVSNISSIFIMIFDQYSWLYSQLRFFFYLFITKMRSLCSPRVLLHEKSIVLCWHFLFLFIHFGAKILIAFNIFNNSKKCFENHDVCFIFICVIGVIVFFLFFFVFYGKLSFMYNLKYGLFYLFK